MREQVNGYGNNYNNDSIQINIKDTFNRFSQIIINYWFAMIIVLLSTTMIAGIICMQTYIPSYENVLTFTVRTVGNSSEQDIMGAQLLENNFDDLSESVLISKIRENLSLKKEEKFILKIEGIDNVNIQKLSVVSGDPKLTERISNEIEVLYPEFGTKSLSNVVIKKISDSSRVSLVSDKERFTRFLIYGFLVGVLFDIVFIIFKFLRHKVVQSTTTMKLLTSLRSYSSLPKLLDSDSKSKKSWIRKNVYDQGIMAIALKLQLNANDTVMFISSKVGEGVTTVTEDLGKYLANEGEKVLIVHIVDLDSKPIIKSSLKDKNELSKEIYYIEKVANLAINIEDFEQSSYTTGTDTETNTFSILINKLKLDYTVILIDGLAIEKTNYLPPLAKIVNKLLYVVRQSETEINEMQKGLEYLEENKFKIDGYILNAVNSEGGEYGISGKLNKYRNYYSYQKSN